MLERACVIRSLGIGMGGWDLKVLVCGSAKVCVLACLWLCEAGCMCLCQNILRGSVTERVSAHASLSIPVHL